MIEFGVEKITDQFGARVLLAADQLLAGDVPQQCLDLLNRYGVLVFPEIGVSDELQVEFSNRLGSMQGSKFCDEGAGETDKLGIYPVSLDPSQAKFLDYILSNEHWHMDGTTYRVPPKATNLKCEVAPRSGGDTEFANLFLAYEAMAPDTRQKIQGLTVIHSAATANLHTFDNPSVLDLQRWLKDGPPTEQPLVWTMADGRKSLVIGSTADSIVGMELQAGRALLKELLDWCTQPQFCYRHRWQQGDMVIWNNPGMLHRALPYTVDSGRLMHRTTIMGVEAVA